MFWEEVTELLYIVGIGRCCGYSGGIWRRRSPEPPSQSIKISITNQDDAHVGGLCVSEAAINVKNYGSWSSASR
jgi:hypothetical protein